MFILMEMDKSKRIIVLFAIVKRQLQLYFFYNLQGLCLPVDITSLMESKQSFSSLGSGQ